MEVGHFALTAFRIDAVGEIGWILRRLPAFGLN